MNLKSRKLWVAVAAIAWAIAGNLLRAQGVDLDVDSIWQVIAAAAAYVGIEGLIDIKAIVPRDKSGN